jgi:hypothetical protein
MADAVCQRLAQLRTGFEEHPYGLADEDGAGPVAVPQVMQPRPNLGVS